MGYDRLKDIFREHIAEKTESFLILGSGMSSLPFDMEADGSYGSICAVDFAVVCIDEGNTVVHEKKLKNLRFECQDVRKLSFPDVSVGNIIDKVSHFSLSCQYFRFLLMRIYVNHKATLDTLFNNDDELVSVNQMLAEVPHMLPSHPRNMQSCSQISVSHPCGKLQYLFVLETVILNR